MADISIGASETANKTNLRLRLIMLLVIGVCLRSLSFILRNKTFIDYLSPYRLPTFEFIAKEGVSVDMEYPDNYGYRSTGVCEIEEEEDDNETQCHDGPIHGEKKKKKKKTLFM
ncbi:hypothetical protein E2542_SST18309 [Spatholobus suberectus]|nr:hypothetical protein E2542_SST18309 [Spatholobus suberectus]